jgi:hypothetical protein
MLVDFPYVGAATPTFKRTLSYVAWTPQSEYRLTDGSKVSGRANYANAAGVEVRTDAGEYRWIERDDIIATRKI